MTTNPFTDEARDMLGKPVKVGDLVAWGHSGRYAATRIGRVYQIDNLSTVRVWIVERRPEKRKDGRWGAYGPWEKVHHSKPHLFIKVDDTDTGIPVLESLR